MSKKRKASMKSKEYWDVNNWLWEGLDSDDELLIAYNRRPSEEMTSMCALCYQWFKSSDEFHNHMVTHIDTSRFHECSVCRKKFLARFLRMRHESIHRYDSNHPFAAYWATQHTDFPADNFVKNHPMKRFKPIPYSPHYLKELRRFQKRNESEHISCFVCEEIFQDFDDLQTHYDVQHAIQECVHCPAVLDNFEMYEVHLKKEHGIDMPMNYPGGRWRILDELARSVKEEREMNVANLKFFHNYASPPELQPNRSVLSSSRPRAVYSRNANSLLKQPFVPSPSKISESLQPRPRLSLGNDNNNSVGENGSPLIRSRSLSQSKDDNENFDSYDYGTEAMLMESDEYEDEDGLYIPEVQIEEQEREMPVLLPVSDEIEWLDTLLEAPRQTSFPCQVCGRVFTDEKMRNRHRRLHNVPGDKPFECKYCKKAFATHSNRKEHERIHTGERPYKCPVCDRRFIQISNLKKHIQTHKDLNNLQCTTCGKQFVKESSLILHQRSHATERKFRCNVCDRAYNYASLLKRHMRIHTGECPYQCPDCQMPFHELVSLHYHRKKMHTGERPHKCEICGRGFILSSDLKKHHRVHMKGPEKEKLANSKILNGSAKSNGNGADNIKTTPTSSSTSTPTKIREYLKKKQNQSQGLNQNQIQNQLLHEPTEDDLEDLEKLLQEVGDDRNDNDEDNDDFLQIEDLNPEITLIVQNDGNIDEDGSFHYEIQDIQPSSRGRSNKPDHDHDHIGGEANICSVEFEAIDVNESKELQILSIKEVSGDEERQILETNSKNNNNPSSITKLQGQIPAQIQSLAQQRLGQGQSGNPPLPILKFPIPASTAVPPSSSNTNTNGPQSNSKSLSNNKVSGLPPLPGLIPATIRAVTTKTPGPIITTSIIPPTLKGPITITTTKATIPTIKPPILTPATITKSPGIKIPPQTLKSPTNSPAVGTGAGANKSFIKVVPVTVTNKAPNIPPKASTGTGLGPVQINSPVNAPANTVVPKASAIITSVNKSPAQPINTTVSATTKSATVTNGPIAVNVKVKVNSNNVPAKPVPLVNNALPVKVKGSSTNITVPQQLVVKKPTVKYGPINKVPAAIASVIGLKTTNADNTTPSKSANLGKAPVKVAGSSAITIAAKSPIEFPATGKTVVAGKSTATAPVTDTSTSTPPAKAYSNRNSNSIVSVKVNPPIKTAVNSTVTTTPNPSNAKTTATTPTPTDNKNNNNNNQNGPVTTTITNTSKSPATPKTPVPIPPIPASRVSSRIAERKKVQIEKNAKQQLLEEIENQKANEKRKSKSNKRASVSTSKSTAITQNSKVSPDKAVSKISLSPSPKKTNANASMTTTTTPKSTAITIGKGKGGKGKKKGKNQGQTDNNTETIHPQAWMDNEEPHFMDPSWANS